MKKFCADAEQIMGERFGKDTIIALATIENGVPYVRYLNAYYENGAFYSITYARSNKIRHITLIILLSLSLVNGLPRMESGPIWEAAIDRKIMSFSKNLKKFLVNGLTTDIMILMIPIPSFCVWN